MNKFFLLAAPVLTVALATPAAAQPAGFRIEGIVAYDELRVDFDGAGAADREEMHGVAYGVGIGYDFPLGTSLAMGVDGEFTETTVDHDLAASEFTARRDIYVGGRLTAAVSGSVNVYGKLGYTNFQTRDRPDNTALLVDNDNLEGVRGALGVQFGDEDGPAYYGFELRFSDYGDDINRRQAALVIGTRF